MFSVSGTLLRVPVSLSGTFGSFHQLELHHSVTGSFPPADVEVDHGARLLQGLHSSAVGHVPHVQLVHSEDDVVHPETHTSCQLTSWRLLVGDLDRSWVQVERVLTSAGHPGRLLLQG